MKNILIVDDDDSYVYLIERRIRNCDGTVSFKSCASGKEALDYMNSLHGDGKRPDIVLLDLNMPVMNGFDFLEAFESKCRENHVSVPPPAI